MIPCRHARTRLVRRTRAQRPSMACIGVVQQRSVGISLRLESWNVEMMIIVIIITGLGMAGVAAAVAV